MTFKEENDALLYNILNSMFFRQWKKSRTQDGMYVDRKEPTIEFYITPDCNQKCEYCYLQKYKDSLYPKDIRDSKVIIENLKKVLQWCIDSKFVGLGDMDMFSGEIWGYPLGDTVLDTMLEYLDKGLSLKKITIPTNASFVMFDKACKKQKEYKKKFMDKGVDLCYSLSIDGAIVDKQERAFNSKEQTNNKNDDYYDKMFSFARDQHVCFHPMLASKSAQQWKENFRWWVDMCKKYSLNFLERVAILEVRNNDWTENSIKYYLQDLDAFIDYMLKEECNEDQEKLAKLALSVECGISGGMNWALLEAPGRIGCTNPTQLTIRLGDLMICPCHRTSYPELNYGKFKLDADGKISGIESNNVYTAMKMLTADVRTSVIKCDTCDFNVYCMKQCWGACKEYNNDPFIPDDNVCEMLSAKIYHLVKRYNEMGCYKGLKELHDSGKISDVEYSNTLKYRDIILSHKEMEKYEK